MTEEIFRNNKISIHHNPENHTFCIDIHTGEGATAILTEDEMLTLMYHTGERVCAIFHPIAVGDYVEIMENAVGTAWRTGCVERIDGSMANIIYGVKTLDQFGGIRGMGIPVPLSVLRRLKR